MNVYKRMAIWALSTGWLLPTGAGLALIDSWFVREVYPLLHGGAGRPAQNSFEPYFFGRQLLMLGFCWLALAVAYWTSRWMADASQE